MKRPASAATDRAIAKIAAALDDGRLTINALDDGSGVVLDVEGEQMLTTNATGMHIIQAIAGGDREADAIAHRLAKHFEVDAQQAQRDVATFVDSVGQGL
jgi:hypothetical protein